MLVLCGSVSKNNIDNFWKLDKINQKPTTNLTKKDDKKIFTTICKSKISIVINEENQFIKKPISKWKKFE